MYIIGPERIYLNIYSKYIENKKIQCCYDIKDNRYLNLKLSSISGVLLVLENLSRYLSKLNPFQMSNHAQTQKR